MRYSLLFLIALAGCAAPQDPCQRQCNHVYNSCVEAASGGSSNPMALERVANQCDMVNQSCVSACRATR